MIAWINPAHPLDAFYQRMTTGRRAAKNRMDERLSEGGETSKRDRFRVGILKQRGTAPIRRRETKP